MNNQELYAHFRRHLTTALKEHDKAQSTYDIGYWQGQKNLTRTLLAELAPDAETRAKWELDNEFASGGAIDPTKATQAILERAHVLIQEAHDEYARGALIRMELKRWLEWYARLAEKGIVAREHDRS